MEYSNKLEYQKEVTDYICDVFDVPELFSDALFSNSNKVMNLNNSNKSLLIEKIKNCNNKLENKLHSSPIIEDYLNLDIKMETGTGKTYVYIKTIFELNKRYGISKFIILVPSIAIKLGTQNFINDSSWHFQQEYGKLIHLNVQNKSTEKNASKKIPNAVKNFVKTSIFTNDMINVLLLNDDYLTDNNYGKEREEVFLDEYSKPVDALASTKPFIIIDEPHRFKDNNSAMTFIKNYIKPQCIIRFGATFPETNGVKDYKNLIYNLSSRKAIVDGLVKGVNVYIEGKRDIDNVDFIIKDLKQGEKITVKYKDKKTTNYIEKEVRKGMALSFLGEGFQGIKLKDITKDEAILSNNLVISKGKLNNDTEKESNHYNSYDFSDETQEAMIRLALTKHFETEKANFMREDIIKTICLFFIEDIASYRNRGKEQLIRNIFEAILKEKLNEQIANINENNEKEVLYKKYLQTTIDNLAVNEKQQLVHGGYFAEDTDKTEGSEYKQILVNKENTLNIYNKDGSFNTFRFIFSKWTLKEGWDNPNVFTIAKLRGSGSENSKLQEVGRGLRLPVDIKMNRKKPNEEDFFLTYIVNNKEKDFALKLIAEICPDEVTKINGKEYLSVEQINNIALRMDKTFDELLLEMVTEKIVELKTENDCHKILDNEAFMERYGEYLTNDNLTNKVTIGKPKSNGTTKIRKSNFAKIKELWEILNQNFIITYKDKAFSDDDMKNIVYESLIDINSNVLEKEIIDFNILETKNIVKSDDKNVILSDEDYIHKEISIDTFHIMKYSEYLKEIHKATNIPITIIHEAIKKFIEEKFDNKPNNMLFRKKINALLIDKIVSKKHNSIEGKFEYQSINTSKRETSLTDSDGNMLDSISSGNLGRMECKGKATINSKYLYDTIQYDSDFELRNINADYGDSVEVYGKIPKNSIRIPKIDGATCSPDFMYVLNDSKGNAKKMSLIIESKNYNSFDDDSRGTEKYTKEYMQKYFETLEKNMREKNIDIKFKYQLAKDKVVSIIEKLLENTNE